MLPNESLLWVIHMRNESGLDAIVEAFIHSRTGELRGQRTASDVAEVLADCTVAAEDGNWSRFDARIDSVLARPGIAPALQLCVLNAAMIREEARANPVALRLLFERMRGLRHLVQDPRLTAMIERRDCRLAQAELRLDAALVLSEQAAAGHAPGSDLWLEFTSQAAVLATSVRELARAAALLDRLAPHAASLPKVGRRFEPLHCEYLCQAGEHARVWAMADPPFVAAVGPAHLANAAIQDRRWREARRWIAVLRSEDHALSGVLALALAIAEGRLAEADRLLADIPPDPGSRQRGLVRILQVDLALARGDRGRAAAAMHLLDPERRNPAHWFLHARLAVLEGDLPRAALLLHRLRGRGTPRMMEYLISHTPEWTTATVARLWMTPVPEDDAGSVKVAAAYPELVGASPAMHTLRTLVETCARLDLPVLICGETGTGKEIVARLLHRHGCPPEAPFHALNCAALTDSLAEAELFGHAAGAFTGAVADSVGLVGAAAGGVLFLDEINSLSLRLQGLLLRLLDHGDYRRVGETTARRAACRFIVASNQPLAEAVAAGAFRPDLRYRLERLAITVPPLRDRRDDIPLLIAHFSAALTGRRDPLSPAILADFQQRDWPGNVRELRNAVEQALLLPPTAMPGPGIRPPSPRPAAASVDPVAAASSGGDRRIPGPPAARQRRARILGLLTEQDEIYPADVVRLTGCDRKTATTDCLALVAAGLLRRIERGRHGRVNPFAAAGSTGAGAAGPVR